MRYSTALQRGGMFRDEPEVLKGLMDRDVPLALAMQAFNSYSATKQQQVAKHLANAGYSATTEKKVDQSGYFNKTAKWDQEFKDRHADDNDSGGPFGWLADAVLWAGESIAQPAFEGLTWAYNRTIGAPMAAGGADEAASEGVGALSALGAARQAIKNSGPSIPGVREVTGAVEGAVEGVVNTAEGYYRIGTGDTTDTQMQDIRNAGLDPAKFSDRVNFYSQDYGERRGPVNDSDVQWLKGLKRWSDDDVDAARELVTSGAMEDLSRSFPALSPQAQDFALRVNKDQKAQLLLEAMSDTTQNSLGGRVIRHAAPDAAPGDWFGPGSVSRGVAAAVAETVATWHIDPAVLAAKGYKAVKAAKYGVAGLPAEKIDRTIQMLKASNDDYTPKGATASRFHDAMQTADDIVTTGVATPEAAKMRASWIRRFPGYDKTLDLLIGQRAGSVGQIRARTIDEAKGEVRHAADAGRDVNPWVMDASPDGKPLWRFTNDDGTKLSPEEMAQQRAKVAEELSTFIVLDAYASGREITGSRLLLPGQMSLNGKLRDTIAPVLEAFTRRDKSLLKQLSATGKKPIDMDDFVVSDATGRWDQLVNPEAAEWLRNNYTFGITHAFSRGWRNFEKTFSNKVIMPSSPDSVKVYRELVSQFMPKRQAQMVTTQYAAANPAERWVMTRQTIGSLLNTMNLRNTPEAQKIVSQLTKGLVPEGEFINGYKVGVNEYYTTPNGNNIRVGDMQMPAAVHPWQLSEGVELPNWRELRGLANRNAVLNAVTRTTDGQMANALVRLWKSSKVTTWSNMARQGIELELFNAWRQPGVLAQHRKARKAVKADILNRKVNDHDLERLANSVNNLTPDDLHSLEKVRRSEPEKYVQTVTAMLERDGFSKGAAEVMARLGSDVDLTEYGEFLASGSERRVRHLAMVGPWDRLRKIRAARHEKKGGDIEDTPLSKHLDGEMAQQMLEASAKQFGTAAESYAWNMAERSTHVQRERIADAAGRNISFRPVKVVNAYEWGDTTPHLWAAELGRRQADPIGELAMRVIARQHLERRADTSRPKLPGEQSVDVKKLAADLIEQEGCW